MNRGRSLDGKYPSSPHPIPLFACFWPSTFNHTPHPPSALRLAAHPLAELEVVKGSKLVGLKYQPMFAFFADRDTSFVVCEDNYVTNDSGTGIVHQVRAFRTVGSGCWCMVLFFFCVCRGRCVCVRVGVLSLVSAVGCNAGISIIEQAGIRER